MNRPAAFAVVLALARSGTARHAGGAVTALPPLPSDVGSADLAAALDFHGVLGLALPLLGTLQGLAPDDLASLRTFAGRSARRGLAVVAETLLVAGALAKAGIPCLCLKGPALSMRLFGDPGVRKSGDVDVLVSAASMPAVDRLLRELGYSPRSYGEMTRMQTRLYRFGLHDVTYAHPARRIAVEIHWRLDDESELTDQGFAALHDRREEVALGGHTVSVMSTADELPYLIGHGARHGWYSLKWLLDVHLLLRSVPAETLAGLTGPGLEEDARIEAATALLLCQRLFDAATPDPDMAEPERAAAVRRAAAIEAQLRAMDVTRRGSEQDDAASRAFQRFMAARGVAARLRIVLVPLFAVHHWCKVRPPLGLWPLYPLVGPILWFRRRIMGHEIR